MFRKFISMATAAAIIASGVSIVSANPASAASATIAIDCDDTSTLTSANGWETVGQFGGSRFATSAAGFQKFVLVNPADVYTINITGCGVGHVVSGANSSSANTLIMSSTGFDSAMSGSTWNTRTGMQPTASLVVTGGSTIPTMPVSGGARNYLMVKNDNNASSEIAITFVDSTTWSNANLSSLSLSSNFNPVAISPSFSASTTSYTASTSNSSVSANAGAAVFGNPTTTTCNSVLLANQGSLCSLSSGSNTIVLTVTALDGTTTKSYTVIVTATLSGGGGGGGGSSICSSDLLSSSSTIKGVTFSRGTRQASSTDFNGNGSSFMGAVTLTPAEASGTGITSISASGGATVRWLYVSPSINSWGNQDISTTANLQGVTLVNNRWFEIKVTGSGCTDYYRIRIIVSSGSTPTLTAAEIAAAAAQAAQAAAAARAAEIATAQTKLSTVLRADKAGTIDEYKSANINISTTASLGRINAEVLKLSANDRSDFAKIKAIAEKIEFDESFFNSTARPTLSTYAKYEVVGVTERILPTINTKILELPAALRADAKAIQDLVKVESFVDRVANTETRATVSATVLVEKGLLPATSPYKYSVIQGLAKYPEGSLNTMAKIEAAIKEQVAKAEAPRLRLAAIKAKIAARKK